MASLTTGADRRILRNPAIISSKVDDEVLGIDPATGEAFSLNETAALIWEFLDQPHSEREILDHLQERFDVDDATCRQSVVELLEKWRDINLILEQAGGSNEPVATSIPVTRNSVVALRANIVITDIDGEAVVVDAPNAAYHRAGATGSRIIALLRQARPVHEIVAALVASYDVDEETCTSQVLEFLTAMNDGQFLRVEA